MANVGSNKGTIGHQIATDIMGDGKTGPPSYISPSPSPGGSFKGRMSVESCEGGGCTVEHTTPSKDGTSYGEGSKTTKHAFTDHKAAHHHIGKLMGLGSGTKAGGLT